MRILNNWIDEFVELTNHLPSPLLFRKWAGISAIAGVLERKVWVRTMNMELYPNLYVVLTGPPGVGKTVATSLVEDLWRAIPGLPVAPKRVTKPSLIDALADAKRSKVYIDGNQSSHLNYNSLLLNAGELGVLIPSYDSEFMNILTDLWDCRMYEEKRRGNNLHVTIPKPQLNMLAATTPAYLNQTLPEAAWDQGFLSRTFLIFSGDTTLVDIFADGETDQDKYSKLRSDLKDINSLVGQYNFSTEARDVIRNWHMAGGHPRPEHPKLVHYIIRRTQQLLKLAMVATASRGDERLITLEDVQTAMGWLMEAEVAMEDIFKAMGAKGDGKIIEEAWHYIYKIFMAKKEPIPEHRLINFFAERTPAYNVTRMIEIMERSRWIEKRITKAGLPGWEPLAKPTV